MDIQISSNFERYLFEASGRDAVGIRNQMGALAQGGRFEITSPLPALRRDFAAAAASEDEVADAIRRVKKDSSYLMDPHTACGMVALEKCAPEGAVPRVVLSTAHPAKFPDAMQEITGERPGAAAATCQFAHRPRALSGARERPRCGRALCRGSGRQPE